MSKIFFYLFSNNFLFGFRLKGLSVNEIQGFLEQDDSACDVLLMPAEDGVELSYEDSEPEDNVLPKDPNHLGKGILSQISELAVYDKEEKLPDVSEVTAEGEVVESVLDETAGEPSHSRRTRGQRAAEEIEEPEPEEDGVQDIAEEIEEAGEQRKLARTHNKDRIWKKTKPQIFGMSVPDFEPQPLKTLPPDCLTPYDFHKLFLDDDFVDKVVNASKLYCVRKGRLEVAQRFNSNSLRVSVAIMHMTGYITPANRDMYWEQRPDTENSFVRDAMSKTTFTSIVANTVFVEQVEPDPEDKYWKVRLLFDQLNLSAKSWVRQSQKLSIDEGIIKYFGPHFLKQFMKGKPHRFGYKVPKKF